jgi:hypothetical protein
MSGFAKGTKALGICDRTGFQYPLADLVWEYKNGQRTGLRVGKDIADPDHPQNFLGRLRITDPMGLRDPRPEGNKGEFRGFFGWAPVGHPLVFMTGAVGTVTVVADPKMAVWDSVDAVWNGQTSYWR